MQFLAIFVDTWRLLRARKLFWVALVITLLVGVLFASLGFNDRGFSLFFFLDLPSDSLRAGSPSAVATSLAAFYQITNWWTTFFGVILGLITCASIFPELMTAGAIDIMLSKPLGRGRLFAYKFLSGLVFMGVQVTVLAVIVVLSIRWRLGFWHPAVFWSVPLGVVLFSYLYAIAVFFGVWTRSTLAALVLTLVVWLGIGGVQWAESLAAQISRTSSASNALGGPAGSINKAEAARRIFGALMLALPKTAETTELVKRSVMRDEDKAVLREDMIDEAAKRTEQLQRLVGRPIEAPSVIRSRAAADLDAIAALEKSPGYILGTSILFEIAVLLLSGWIFSRRDY